ncbi:MAG: S8 family peptidase [Pirellulaceae bacterium]|nr:S8 family peptidase [Pirellulaceae bacterium]
MALSYKQLRELLLRGAGSGRFTQDSPVLPDVWIQFAQDLKTGQSNLLRPIDLLMTPQRDFSAGRLRECLQAALVAYRAQLRKSRSDPLTGQRANADLSLNRSYAVGRFYFDEAVCVLLPLTKWWHEYVWRHDTAEKQSGGRKQPKATAAFVPADLTKKECQRRLLTELDRGPAAEVDNRLDDLVWLVRVVGTLEVERQREIRQLADPDKEVKDSPPTSQDLLRAFTKLIAPLITASTRDDGKSPPSIGRDEGYPLWAVAQNRDIKTTIWRSVESTKADAGRLLFKISCDKLRWAVIDSGIDATHPAFRDLRKKDPGPAATRSRILETYDFTRLRSQIPADGEFTWEEMRKKLRIPHDKKYQPPVDRHGTHVAGILAMNWRHEDDPEHPDDHDLVGMCPDLELFDMRVLSADGGTEFDILGALQFIRWLNAYKDEPVIHGVNISISLPHDKANYACGRTPICDECERLMGSGVVVVAAAGNEGWAHYDTEMGRRDGFRTVCITDPGNADSVITVGSTHRYKPHTYGVSYFSSRGPTGDGRIKPDLVAPGEKIKSCVPGGEAMTLDGTSMAAPHVSGAAALLMARHRELIGQPQRIKQILCRTATDLGRERYFQGAGMLDVLRALQSV